MIWGAAGVAFLGALLPHHPLDYLYNHVVRRVTGTEPLPANTRESRLACLLVGLLLVTTGVAFFFHAVTVGYGLGVASKLYIRFRDKPDVLAMGVRIVSSISRF